MAVPAKILPNEEAIMPASASDLDGWSKRVWMDPLKDWSASTFTADAPFLVDASHKADEAPYVLVYLTAALMKTAGTGVLDMKLAEDTRLRRTFIELQLTVVPR